MMTSMRSFLLCVVLLFALTARLSCGALANGGDGDDDVEEWWQKGCLRTGICARRAGIHGVPEELAKQLAGIRPSAQIEIEGSTPPKVISFDEIYGGYTFEMHRRDEQSKKTINDDQDEEEDDNRLHVVDVDEDGQEVHDDDNVAVVEAAAARDGDVELSRGMFWHGTRFERLNEFRVYLTYNAERERTIVIECVDCDDVVAMRGIAGSFLAAWSPYVVGAEKPAGGDEMEFALDRTRVCTETYSVLDDNGDELVGRGCAMFAVHALGYSRSLVLAGHSRAAYLAVRSLRSVFWATTRTGFVDVADDSDDDGADDEGSVVAQVDIERDVADLAPSWAPDAPLDYRWDIDALRADVFDYYRPHGIDQRLWGTLRSTQKQLLVTCALDPVRRNWLGTHRYPHCLEDYRKQYEHASEEMREHVTLVIHSLQVEVPMLTTILKGLADPAMSWHAWKRCEGKHFCIAPVDRESVPHACPEPVAHVPLADVLPARLAPHPMSPRPYRLRSDRPLRSLAEVRAHFLCLPHVLGEFPANVRIDFSFAPPPDARLAQALYAAATTANDMAVLSAHVSPADFYSPQRVASTPSRAQVDAALAQLARGHLSLGDVEAPPQQRGIFALTNNGTALRIAMQSGFDAAPAHFHFLLGPDAEPLPGLSARFNATSALDAALEHYASSVDIVLDRLATLRDLVVQPALSLRTAARRPSPSGGASTYSLGAALDNVRRRRAVRDCLSAERCADALVALSALPDEPIEFGELGMSHAWRRSRVVECTRRMVMQTMLEISEGGALGGIADLAFAPPSVMMRTVSLLLNDWSAYRIGIDWTHENVSRAAVALNSRHLAEFIGAAYEGHSLSFDERRRRSDIGNSETQVAHALGPLLGAHNLTSASQADAMAARIIDALHPMEKTDDANFSCPALLWRHIGGAFASLRAHKDTHSFLASI
jgi:hypothetical protein